MERDDGFICKSEILLDGILDCLKESQINIIKKPFCCIDATNAISEKQTGLYRRIGTAAPHSLYINCGCHRLALFFKYLILQFTWSSKIDLWKMFHFSWKKKKILSDLQNGYGMKVLSVIKAASTGLLSHSTTCKWCREIYLVIIEATNGILIENENLKWHRFRSSLLEPITVFYKRNSFCHKYTQFASTKQQRRFRTIYRATASVVLSLEWINIDIDIPHLFRLSKYCKY